MRLHLFLYCLLSIFFVTVPMLAAPSAAESADSAKFTRVLIPVDAVTLQGEGARVTLWGIRPVSSPSSAFDLKAIELMDSMIGTAPVACRVMSGALPEVTARCSVHTGEDLGLELLSRGYAVVDRRQDTSTVPAYTGAQKSALRNGEGIWREVVSDEDGGASVPALLFDALPVIGLLLVALVMHFRLRHMETLQQEELEQARRKETQLVTRERHVLAATIEGELTENKNRIEAFLTIYGAVLENLKSKTETPKYQQGGDIVQKHPSLSKTVFEASAGKLSLLDMKLAAQLSRLYASFPKEQEYVNIEPGVPLESAIALVEKVLREAEVLMPPVTSVILALDEIVAGGRKHES
jgi:hypothetical protein